MGTCSFAYSVRVPTRARTRRLVCVRQVLVWKELSYGRMNTKERRMMITEVNILREVEHPVRRASARAPHVCVRACACARACVHARVYMKGEK